MKKRLKNDNGYSLVELIIVIAIIAILSGIAMLTISSINSAKASAALENFDTTISVLSTRTRAQDADTAMMIKRVDDGYEVYFGTSSDGTETKWTQTSTSAELKMDRVDIYYTKTGETSAIKLEGNQIIKLKKADGSVVSGAGVYEFRKSGSGAVGRVTLNESTGSHYFGK